MLFHLISTIKVKLVDTMVQSTYLCAIFTCQAQKITNCNSFCLILTLGEIQDGDQAWWRHRFPAASSLVKYTLSCWKDQRPSTEGKIVSKYCNTRGGGPSTPPRWTTVWVWLCVNKQRKASTEAGTKLKRVKGEGWRRAWNRSGAMVKFLPAIWRQKRLDFINLIRAYEASLTVH